MLSLVPMFLLILNALRGRKSCTKEGSDWACHDRQWQGLIVILRAMAHVYVSNLIRWLSPRSTMSSLLLINWFLSIWNAYWLVMALPRISPEMVRLRSFPLSEVRYSAPYWKFQCTATPFYLISTHLNILRFNSCTTYMPSSNFTNCGSKLSNLPSFTPTFQLLG